MATSTSNTEIYKLLVEMSGKLSGIETIVPTVKKLDEVVRTGNGKPPMTQRLDDVENYIDCQKAVEKQKAEDKQDVSDKKLDYKTKIKLQMIGAIIGFAVVTIGGWIASYIYIVLPLLPHK